ncbi:DUF805 domain-containing protein [Enterococcus sp. ALS3]|uniref:DUF805 domain-containing protein n=1 Tax=Enterococcus alishanensis TaxID=1303817 RepID=A0ABS6THW9_9ENTE|nr:DUF805 domain-containing protein [Enterococcus alishanensis]MBV7392498.1 DUF805 domain-containing protein [Enterococcus alishanensis]
MNNSLSNFWFIGAFKAFFKNYFNFTGKENRKNFWWVISTLYILSIIPTGYLMYLFIGTSMSISGGTSSAKAIIMSVISHEKLPLSVLFISVLLLIIPCISLCVRRFKDVGFTGVSFFVLFVSSNLFIVQSIINIQNNHMFFSKGNLLAPIIGLTLCVINIIIMLLPSNFIKLKSKSKISNFFIL